MNRIYIAIVAVMISNVSFSQLPSAVEGATRLAMLHARCRQYCGDKIANQIGVDASDINKQDKDGFTALQNAGITKNADCARALLDLGADPFIKTSGANKTALDWVDFHQELGYPNTQEIKKVLEDHMYPTRLGYLWYRIGLFWYRL